MEHMSTEGTFGHDYMYTFSETVLPGVSRPYIDAYPVDAHTHEQNPAKHRETYLDKEHVQNAATENVVAINTGPSNSSEACKIDVDKVLEVFPFVCGLCYRQYNKVDCYFEHLASHTECKDDFFHICFDETQKRDEGSKVFFCGLCDTVFPTVCLLHDHMLSTENVNKYIFDKSTNRTQPYNPESSSNSLLNPLDKTINKTQPCEPETSLKSLSNNIESTNKTQLLDSETSSKLSLRRNFPQASDDLRKPFKDEGINEIEAPVEANNEDICVVRTQSCASDSSDESTSSNTTIITKKTIPPLRIRKAVPKKKQPIGRPPKKRGRKKKEETNKKEAKKREAKKKEAKKKEAKKIETKEKETKAVTEKTTEKESTNSSADASTESKTAADSNEDGFDESLPPLKKKRVFKGIRSSMPWWQVPVPCQICGLMYTKASLKRHEELHAEVVRRDFKCEICGKAFRRKAELRIHEAVHSDVADFICDLCGKAFKLLEAMKAHRKRHTFERNIPCPICPAMFKCKRTLKTHMTRHSDYKPFVCTVCGQSFRRRDGLARHKYMHTDHRPFLCPTCNKGFKTKSNLRLHEKVHRPYEYFCPYCNKAFSCDSNRKSHMKTHMKDMQHTEQVPHVLPRMQAPTANPYNPEFKLNQSEFTSKPSHPVFRPSHPEFKPSHPEFKTNHPEFKSSHPEFNPLPHSDVI